MAGAAAGGGGERVADPLGGASRGPRVDVLLDIEASETPSRDAGGEAGGRRSEGRRSEGRRTAGRLSLGLSEAGSPPADLNELAAYTRREREKFEALAEAHQDRMRQLMSSSLPLSPATPGPNAHTPGRGRAVHERLQDVQRHFDQHRQQQQLCLAAY